MMVNSVVHGLITGLITLAILSLSQAGEISTKIIIAGLVLAQYINGLSSVYFGAR